MTVGRAKDPCRREFVPVVDGNSTTNLYSCIHCVDEAGNGTCRVKSVPRQMKRHLKRCVHYQHHAKENNADPAKLKKDTYEFFGSTKAQAPVLVVADSVAAVTSSSALPIPTSKKRKIGRCDEGGTILQYTNRVSVENAEAFRRKLGSFVIEKGLPFNLFDDKMIREAFNIVGLQQLKLPTAHYVSTTVLNEEYELIHSKVNKAIAKEKGVAISMDGWTDINRRGVMNVVACTPKPVLFSHKRFGTTRETADNLVEYLGEVNKELEAIKEINNKPPAVLYILITDSPAVMRSFRLKVNMDEETLRKWIAYGCGCHSANNLGKDYLKLPMIEDVVANSKVVAKYFKNKHVPLDQLRASNDHLKIKPGTIQMTVDTRWLTHLNMFRSIDANKPGLRHWCDMFKVNYNTKKGDVTKQAATEALKIKSSIEDPSLFSSIVEAMQVLNPIALVLYHMEQDDCPLSFTVPAYVYLKVAFEEFPDLQVALDKRWKEAGHPFLVLAFALDPFWREFRFSNECQLVKLDGKSIDALISEAHVHLRHWNLLSVDALLCLADFITQDFSTTLGVGVTALYEDNDATEAELDECMHPKDWWSLLAMGFINGYDGAEELRNFCVALFSGCSSAASGERNFKTWKRCMTSVRNRLSDSKYYKQVYCSFNGKGMKKSQSLRKRTPKCLPKMGNILLISSVEVVDYNLCEELLVDEVLEGIDDDRPWCDLDEFSLEEVNEILGSSDTEGVETEETSEEMQIDGATDGKVIKTKTSSNVKLEVCTSKPKGRHQRSLTSMITKKVDPLDALLGTSRKKTAMYAAKVLFGKVKEQTVVDNEDDIKPSFLDINDCSLDRELLAETSFDSDVELLFQTMGMDVPSKNIAELLLPEQDYASSIIDMFVESMTKDIESTSTIFYFNTCVPSYQRLGENGVLPFTCRFVNWKEKGRYGKYAVSRKLFDFHYIYFPVFVNEGKGHWCGCILDTFTWVFWIMDSIQGVAVKSVNFQKEMDSIIAFLKQVYNLENGEAMPKVVQTEPRSGVPQQRGDTACGPFVCMQIYCLITDTPFAAIKMEDILIYRKLVASKLSKKTEVKFTEVSTK